MSQYTLSLALPATYSADNFFISDANREAWQWINAWPNWPSHALILYGPHGCGKSHLATIWAAKSHAMPNPNPAAKGHRLIEDIDKLTDQQALLHLFNATRENKNALLMTSSVAPAQLPFTLPDLTSRLLSVPHMAIGAPDDALLAGVMRKQFADRQMKVGDEVIAYMLPRMERSLDKAKELVETLDKAALAEKKGITIPFVKKIL